MREWLSTKPITLWNDIENNMTPDTNLTNWLFSTTTSRPHLHHYSPTIQASVKTWRTLHYTKWSHHLTKPLHIPINTLKLLTPDLLFPSWITEQVTHTYELRTIATSKSFLQIQKDYNALAKDYFTYYRIQQCLAANPFLEGSLPIKIWNYLFSDNPDPKGASLIYSILQEKNMFHKSKPFTD